MKTLVLANQKGGVGKSAVATLLAHYFRKLGCRVLAIDLDHQGNFSDPLRKSQRVAVAEVPASALLTQTSPVIPSADFVLVAADQDLSGLERQPSLQNAFANNLRVFLKAMEARFDVCLIDTNPNPDIRMIAALVSAEFVLSPIQLNQEALDGVHALLNHHRVGVRKIKTMLNPKLHLIGLLPVMVEANPFQRENFLQLVQKFHPILIPYGTKPGQYASMPRRSAVAEAQAEGLVLWEMKKTAARDAWREIEVAMVVIAKAVLDGAQTQTTPITPINGADHGPVAG
ncbi:ParA family protein [Hydrogenophaga pseudoflava]|jgi:chromosome partitioning protein|uniref:ParA family protein n=1 Tax=Hydrogenophaga pseudoflava TaxID=47421 RepID=UPI0027E3EACC|nr:ParA family protein [Hydrogenophaga pseudoflava]MDQ7746346.1 ParA family protein [Hydrogenophaga pseudoflava]